LTFAAPVIRIRIIQKPFPPSIDGLQLDIFEVGEVYQVGNVVGSLLLAEGWAEPAPIEDDLPVADISIAPRDPPNLIRERYDPGTDVPAIAADMDRPHRRDEDPD
jgi:hypothetical protein